MKILILGMGNELYGDDGVGIHVIRHIQKDRKKRPSAWPDSVDFEECCVSGLSLLDVITGYDVPSTIKVIAVEAKSLYHLGEGLTTNMAAAVPNIVSTVKDVLESLLPENSRLRKLR